MPAPILELIRKADKLPSLPAVAAEVLRLTQSSEVDVVKLVATIQKEPALAVSVLKAVNSSLFGLTRKVTSLNQATVILGLRTVKVLALSFSLVDVLSEQGNFDYQTYWRRSLITAVAARLLAQAVHCPFNEEAFVCGLLSDVGMVAASRAAPELYRPVLQQWQDDLRPLSELEQEKLGVTHAQMGRELLRAWNLPDSLCAIIGAHHGEGLNDLPEESGQLARFVYCAAKIAGIFNKESVFSEFDGIKDECRALTGVTEECLENVLAGLDTQVSELAAILSIRVGSTMNYAQLLAEAAAQLAQLSSQSERAGGLQQDELIRTESLVRERRIKSFEAQLAALANRAAPPAGAALGAAGQRFVPPTKPLVTPFVEIGVAVAPGSGHGDFHDFVKLPDGRIGLLLGVVHCGEAWELPETARKILAERLCELREPVLALCGANEALAGSLAGNGHIAACLAIYDPVRHVVQLAGAGHTPPFLFNAAARPRLSVLEMTGYSLGLAQGAHFSLALKGRAVQVSPGDKLFLYTGGLLDAEDERGRAFGSEKIAGVLDAHLAAPPQDAAARVLSELELFRGKQPQKGDITAICIRFL